MSPIHNNRGRINCAPIPSWSAWGKGLPPALEPLAIVYKITPHAPHGVLVKVRRTGLYAVWIGGALQSIPQAKAIAALEAMHAEQAP